VNVRFDGEKIFSFSVNKYGELDSESNAAASVFDYLIERLKKHVKVYVRFSDGRESTFSLRGASRAIGDCRSRFSQ